MEKKKIILFGFGAKCLGSLSYLTNNYNVVAIMDNDPEKQAMSYKGIPVGEVNFISQFDFDELFILPAFYKFEMIQDCLKLGVPSDKIRCYFNDCTERELGWNFVYQNNGVIANKGKISLHMIHATDFCVFQEIFAENTYSVGIHSSNAICIDVGMNVGMAALYFALMDNVEKVYAFEPFPKTFEQAKTNINLSDSIISDKIEAFNYGLGDKECLINVSYDANMTGGNSIVHPNDNSLPQEHIKICEAAKIISKIAEKHNGQDIILKIDCEGSEFMILENLKANNLLSCICIILMETHEYGEHRQQDILRILQTSGFIYFASYSAYGIGMVYAVRI